MDFSKLKVKKKYIGINVGRFTLCNNMSIEEKRFIYMTISKDFFVIDKDKVNISVNMSDSVSAEEAKIIKDLKNDNLHK